MKHLFLLFVVFSAACDGSLVSDAYRGEPLLTVSGEVRLVDKTGDAAFPSGELRLALMWLTPRGAPDDALFVTAVAQRVSLVAAFPARYQLDAYAPPPTAALLADDATTTYAIAVLAAYVDIDGDGAFGRDVDALVGGSTAQHVILYAPESLERAWLETPVTPGYHLMTAQAAGGSCKKLGHMALGAAGATDFEVKVFASVPANLFPDVLCDGGTSFTAGCPSPNKVATDCDKGKADPYICAHCPRS